MENYLGREITEKMKKSRMVYFTKVIEAKENVLF